jgi:hypothetical protein
MTHGRFSIWFFIGLLLATYGVLILGAGIYDLTRPADKTVVLGELHASIWWGGLLLLIGVIYAWVYRPRLED